VNFEQHLNLPPHQGIDLDVMMLKEIRKLVRFFHAVSVIVSEDDDRLGLFGKDPLNYSVDSLPGNLYYF